MTPVPGIYWIGVVPSSQSVEATKPVASGRQKILAVRHRGRQRLGIGSVPSSSGEFVEFDMDGTNMPVLSPQLGALRQRVLFRNA